jgi:hypothetical protein
VSKVPLAYKEKQVPLVKTVLQDILAQKENREQLAKMAQLVLRDNKAQLDLMVLRVNKVRRAQMA